MLLRGKAVLLLGNTETGRMAVMQDDYYWLEVTSCLYFFPHEARRCRTGDGCCVELSLGNLPLRRNEGLLGKDAPHLNTHTHKEERDAPQIRRRLYYVLKIAMEFIALVKNK